MFTSRSLKVLILSEKIIDSKYSLCISEKDKKLSMTGFTDLENIFQESTVDLLAQ